MSTNDMNPAEALKHHLTKILATAKGNAGRMPLEVSEELVNQAKKALDVIEAAQAAADTYVANSDLNNEGDPIGGDTGSAQPDSNAIAAADAAATAAAEAAANGERQAQ